MVTGDRGQGTGGRETKRPTFYRFNICRLLTADCRLHPLTTTTLATRHSHLPPAHTAPPGPPLEGTESLGPRGVLGIKLTPIAASRLLLLQTWIILAACGHISYFKQTNACALPRPRKYTDRR